MNFLFYIVQNISKNSEIGKSSKFSSGGLRIYLPIDFLLLPGAAFPIALRTRFLG